MKGSYNMDKEKGRGFKTLLSLAFTAGTAVYFFAAVYTDSFVGKAGFALLMLFSLLSGAGIAAADLSVTAYFRTSTKLAAAAYPLAINGGALAAEIFLIKHMNTAALISSAAASVIAVICAGILIKRYREDDF